MIGPVSSVEILRAAERFAIVEKSDDEIWLGGGEPFVGEFVESVADVIRVPAVFDIGVGSEADHTRLIFRDQDGFAFSFGTARCSLIQVKMMTQSARARAKRGICKRGGRQ